MFRKIILTCTVSLVFGMASLQAQGIAQEHNKVILRIETSQGCTPYITSLLIYDDGMGLYEGVSYSHDEEAESSFLIDRAELLELVALIRKTDFESLRKNKLTTGCPTSRGGLKTTYFFSTLGGEEILDSCEHALDDASPLFYAIQKIQIKASESLDGVKWKKREF